MNSYNMYMDIYALDEDVDIEIRMQLLFQMFYFVV